MFPELRKLERAKGVLKAILFGSYVRGKRAPRDVDVLVLVETDAVVLPKLAKNFHVVRLEVSGIFKSSLFRTALSEGFLPNGRAFSSEFGFHPSVVYTYDLKGLEGTGKSRFSHALFGRSSGEGLLFRLGGTRLGSGAVSVPSSGDSPLLEFFKSWKIGFSRKPVLFKS
ncbi:MAG: nucleotidyltransferase domain-containing protein [archaeon]